MATTDWCPCVVGGVNRVTCGTRDGVVQLVSLRWLRQLSGSVRSLASLCRRGLCRPCGRINVCVVEWVVFGLYSMALCGRCVRECEVFDRQVQNRLEGVGGDARAELPSSRCPVTHLGQLRPECVPTQRALSVTQRALSVSHPASSWRHPASS